MQRREELGLIKDFIGEFGHEFAQPVGAVSVAATGHRQVQPLGDLGSEAIFLVRRAAVGDLDGVRQLKHRMRHGGVDILWDGLIRVRIE